MWVVGGGGGGERDAGYCEDASLMQPTSLLGQETRARFHSDPLLQLIESSYNLCIRGAMTGCHDSLAFTECPHGVVFLTQTVYNG